ncbi:cytochrome P450 3A14-like isoform X2 [Dermacentor variabilis]|uniref:cytochrome P450 3A14-like isoform X2 n=1 Tax=Dermacentor variabilis TaxID=34621 RepID=UPI003F5B11F7
MIATLAVLIVTTGLLAVLIAWRRRHFSYFEDLGVPGPKPNLIWGNLLEYYQDDRYKVIGKWLKKYGDIFGFYNGDVPFLVVNDLEFLEYVFVRKFGNFVDRGLTMLTDQMHPILGKSILHAKGNDWKSIRSSVNYGLSAAKIKMDGETRQRRGALVRRVPASVHGLHGARRVWRRHSLPARTSPPSSHDRQGRAGRNHDWTSAHDRAFDTTGTALSYVTFFIAKHQEVQEKVRQEVRSALADGQKTSVDYEIVTRKLKYLQQVIDESLRLLPPALIFTTRRAKEDFEYNGLRFKAGTCVMSPTYQVHTDSRYWPDPLVFDPNRVVWNSLAMAWLQSR